MTSRAQLTQQRPSTNVAPHVHIQELESGVIMATVPTGMKSHEIKQHVNDFYAKQPGSQPVRYRTIGYRNFYTPMELERIIIEVDF